jgi:hypothetical protein
MKNPTTFDVLESIANQNIQASASFTNEDIKLELLNLEIEAKNIAAFQQAGLQRIEEILARVDELKDWL